jgi:hypothetical protein
MVTAETIEASANSARAKSVMPSRRQSLRGLLVDRERPLHQRCLLGITTLDLVQSDEVKESLRTSGWSGPSAVSWIANARFMSDSALASRSWS